MGMAGGLPSTQPGGRKCGIKVQVDQKQSQKIAKEKTKLLPGYYRHADGSIRKIKETK